MAWESNLPPFRKYKKEVFTNVIKTGQFIYQIGESKDLRIPSQEVLIKQINTPEFKRKIKYLKKCLIKYRKLTGIGRGITAVQIGIPEKFSVIYTPEHLMIIINPKITKSSTKKLIYPEMCMSANPIIAKVIRPSWIEFEYFDEFGKKQFWEIKDNTELGIMMNRVFQHEIDHMEGIINIDKIKSNTLIFESDPTFYDSAKFEEVD
jgi:peptide deformylase